MNLLQPAGWGSYVVSMSAMLREAGKGLCQHGKCSKRAHVGIPFCSHHRPDGVTWCCAKHRKLAPDLKIGSAQTAHAHASSHPHMRTATPTPTHMQIQVSHPGTHCLSGRHPASRTQKPLAPILRPPQHPQGSTGYLPPFWLQVRISAQLSRCLASSIDSAIALARSGSCSLSCSRSRSRLRE